MKLKHAVACALGAAVVASPSAFAGLTGNVGGVSEYMFRGLQQNANDPSIQGGIDYASDSGLYIGTWASNVDWGAGGSEIDLYGGFTGKLTDSVSFDVGGILYYYPEKEEPGQFSDGTNFQPNTFEAYAGLVMGPVTFKYFYSPSYFGLVEPGKDDETDNSYFLLSGAFPLTSSLNLTASAGYTLSGDKVWLDGPDGLSGTKLKDDYIDYSLGLAKTIDGGFTATFQVIGTDFKNDDPGLVIALKKTFDL